MARMGDLFGILNKTLHRHVFYIFFIYLRPLLLPKNSMIVALLAILMYCTYIVFKKTCPVLVVVTCFYIYISCKLFCRLKKKKSLTLFYLLFIIFYIIVLCLFCFWFNLIQYICHVFVFTIIYQTKFLPCENLYTIPDSGVISWPWY